MITANSDGHPIVSVDVRGFSGTIVLRREEKRNALSREMIAAISQALSDLHQERRVRSVILVGAGPAFCAGSDLAEIHAAQQDDEPHATFHEDVVGLRDLLEQMLRHPKPIISAVTGAALGAGAALVLASDLVIAGPSGQFGFPEVRRGLSSSVAAPLLVFRLGGGAASRLMLTGEPVGAEEALRLGAFHEVTSSDEQVWARAQHWADLIAGCASESIQMTKRMINEHIGEELETMLTGGAAMTATGRTTEAAAEGVKAFLEKRPPEWK